MSSANQTIQLYRNLLHTANNFSAYNFRSYAKRRIHDAFKEHKTESDPAKVKELLASARENLKMLQRQTTVSQFFQLDRLVVEGEKDRVKQTGWL